MGVGIEKVALSGCTYDRLVPRVTDDKEPEGRSLSVSDFTSAIVKISVNAAIVKCYCKKSGLSKSSRISMNIEDI